MNDASEAFERLTAAFADFAVSTNYGRFAAKHDVRRSLQGVQKRLPTTGERDRRAGQKTRGRREEFKGGRKEKQESRVGGVHRWVEERKNKPVYYTLAISYEKPGFFLHSLFLVSGF